MPCGLTDRWSSMILTSRVCFVSHVTADSSRKREAMLRLSNDSDSSVRFPDIPPDHRAITSCANVRGDEFAPLILAVARRLTSALTQIRPGTALAIGRRVARPLPSTEINEGTRIKHTHRGKKWDGADGGEFNDRNVISTAVPRVSSWDLITCLIYSGRGCFCSVSERQTVTETRLLRLRRVLITKERRTDEYYVSSPICRPLEIEESRNCNGSRCLLCVLRSRLALLHRFSLSPPVFARRSDASRTPSRRDDGDEEEDNVVVFLCPLSSPSSATPYLKSIDTFMQYRLSNAATATRAVFKFYGAPSPFPGKRERASRRVATRCYVTSSFLLRKQRSHRDVNRTRNRWPARTLPDRDFRTREAAHYPSFVERKRLFTSRRVCLSLEKRESSSDNFRRLEGRIVLETRNQTMKDDALTKSIWYLLSVVAHYKI